MDPQTRDLRPGYALSVWLEPGHDGGGIGAWLVDVPGVFAAVHNPQRALSAILTATARTRTWLDGHGDDLGLGPLGRVDVVGEMPARVRSDGHEVNATFPWDRRALAADEVDVAVRRLGWQLDDLLALAGDVDRFEDAHGPLPTDDGTGERTADAILRHVAGAAAWYVEQLDGARSGLAADAGDAATVLTGARARSRERLLGLGAADDGREVTDEHGETWTLAKVVRRSLYHAFDHLWELERRLARADGTGDRIEVTLERRPDARTMAALLRSVGWDGRQADPIALGRGIDGATEFASAWDGDRLVGTARSLTDAALHAHISTVVVHPALPGPGRRRAPDARADGWPRARPVLAQRRARHGRLVREARVRA